MIHPRVVFSIAALLFASHAFAQTSGDSSLAPVYDGDHVISSLQPARLPDRVSWSTQFMEDARIVTHHGNWYFAEMTCLLDETGQVRDGKYLAALLLAHPTTPEDAKTARELALAATADWNGKSDPDAWQILGAALSQGGDFTGAVAAQSQAIKLATDAGWETAVLEKRLEALRSSRPVADEVVVIPAVAAVTGRSS